MKSEGWAPLWVTFFSQESKDVRPIIFHQATKMASSVCLPCIYYLILSTYHNFQNYILSIYRIIYYGIYYIIRLLGRNPIYLSSAFRSQSRYYHKTGVISLFFFLSLCFLRGLFCSMGEKMTQTKKNSNIKSRHIRVNCVHFSTRSRHIAAKQHNRAS